jgi:uncharacterized membrane protein
MFSKSNLLATLVSGITMFVLGYAIFGILGESLLESHTLTNIMKDTPDFIHLFLGCLISAFALSTLYGKWARGHHSFREGAEFGVWIGVYYGLGEGLIMFATSTLTDFTGYIITGLLNIIFFLIIGAIIALIYKATSKKAS